MGVPGSQQRQTIMSAFEDEFEIPAASEVDPAAEFLAKEQEELGDIGQDLGLGAPAQTEDVLAPSNEEEDNGFVALANNQLGDGDPNPFLQDPVEDSAPVMMDGKDIYAGMEELKVKARQELEDWYKRYETQVDKTKSSNREEETKFDNIEMNGIEPGTEWERVSKHCDFSSKAPGHTKDVSRMRSIMLQLKQNQTVKA